MAKQSIYGGQHALAAVKVKIGPVRNRGWLRHFEHGPVNAAEFSSYGIKLLRGQEIVDLYVALQVKQRYQLRWQPGRHAPASYAT
jgi:hypothetical protein